MSLRVFQVLWSVDSVICVCYCCWRDAKSSEHARAVINIVCVMNVFAFGS
jgi:hypothetical protein